MWAGQDDRKSSVIGGTSAATPTTGSSGERSETQHLAVELADWKAKLRKQRQELLSTFLK